MCGKLEESYSVLNTVFSTMKTYGQRISFASGRVEMLQGNMDIKMAGLRCKNGQNFQWAFIQGEDVVLPLKVFGHENGRVEI